MTTVLLNDFSKPSIFTAASSTYFKGLVKMINKRTQATTHEHTTHTRAHSTQLGYVLRLNFFQVNFTLCF